MIAEFYPGTQKTSVKAGRREREDRILNEELEQEGIRALWGGWGITTIGSLLQRTYCANTAESLELWVQDKALEIRELLIFVLFLNFLKEASLGAREKGEMRPKQECRRWSKSCNYMSCWILICRFPNCSKWLHSPEFWILLKENVIVWWASS